MKLDAPGEGRSIEVIRRHCGATELLSASAAHLAPAPAIAQRTAGAPQITCFGDVVVSGQPSVSYHFT